MVDPKPRHFAIMATDKPGHAELRARTRPAHLEYLGQAKGLRLAGPLRDEAGNAVGTLLIVEGESLDAVRTWAENDPYNLARLFESVVVRPFDWLYGAPS